MFGKLRKHGQAVRSVCVSKHCLTAVPLALCLVLVMSNRPFTLLFSSLHSKDSLQNMANDLNSQRTQMALDYFSLTPRRTLQELRAMSHPDNSSFRFTIALVTMGRKKPSNSQRNLGYVLQSAASVASMVKRKKTFRDSFFFVCNVDPSPNNHTDAVILKDYLPYVERYGNSTMSNVSNLQIPGTEKLYRKTEHSNSYERERNDYTFCLQAALRFHSQYYLILQDDAILHPDFSDVLDHSLAKLTKPQECRNSGSSLLNHLVPSYISCLLDHPPYTSHLESQRRSTVSSSLNSSFAYIKFYFPERWQGFAFEPLRMLDLVSLGAVGGGLGLFLHAIWTFRHKHIFQPSWRVFLSGIAISLLISFVLGRQNVNELRRFSKHFYRFQPSPRCCIPAMLYPAPVMPFLITWLAESPQRSLVDLRISDCFEHYGVPAYYIEPNLVRHVGMVTTLPKVYEKPVEEFLIFL